LGGGVIVSLDVETAIGGDGEAGGGFGAGGFFGIDQPDGSGGGGVGIGQVNVEQSVECGTEIAVGLKGGVESAHINLGDGDIFSFAQIVERGCGND